jgi:hypothetical protein
MFGSMTADITDEDELATGMRREGMYVATGGFLGKIVSIITLLLGGGSPTSPHISHPAMQELKARRQDSLQANFRQTAFTFHA